LGQHFISEQGARNKRIQWEAGKETSCEFEQIDNRYHSPAFDIPVGIQVNKQRFERAVVHTNQSHTDGQFKAPWPCTTGIEQQDTLLPLNGGLMRMTADNGAEAPGDGIKIEIVEIMEDIDAGFCDFKDFEPRKVQRILCLIDIAPHRHHRRYLAQTFKHLLMADITGMHNQINFFQNFECFGSNQAMGVGYDTDGIFVHGIFSWHKDQSKIAC
jgi:hypothetical protein